MHAKELVTFSRHPGKPHGFGITRRIAENTSSPFKFSHARTALKYGLRQVGIGSGDCVLVPDYICASAIEPFEELSVHPQYYPVDNALQPDWDVLSQLITTETRALLIVHYFGQPQPIELCEAFCHEHGLMLLEDNAHGHGAMHNNRLLGTFGVVGVTAPRKSFSVINGAYLYLADDTRFETPTLSLQPSRSKTVKRWLMRGLSTVPVVSAAFERRQNRSKLQRRIGPPPDYGSQDSFRDPPLPADYAMDATAHEILQHQDIESVRARRQHIYGLWLAWADAQGLVPVFSELAPGAMPLVFPAYTPSHAESRKWFERGYRAGIDIHSWPTLPQSVVNENGRAMRIWERLVCFPIHQEMESRRLLKRLKDLCHHSEQ